MAYQLFAGGQTALAFHQDLYQPRVSANMLDKMRKNINPFSAIPESIEMGKKIYFGKGMCVSCHNRDGKGAFFPGHPPRDFTDIKWQELRSDGELMWVLKNGSPGTGMKAVVGKLITEEEGWRVIHFIRTFKGNK